MPCPRKPASPFRYSTSSPEIIRLVVMMYVRSPLSFRNVEDLLFERGNDICHEMVRLWWPGFGPLFAADVRRQRVSWMQGFREWRWQLDEVFVKSITCGAPWITRARSWRAKLQENVPNPRLCCS